MEALQQAMANPVDFDVRRGAAMRQIWLSVADYGINIVVLLLFSAAGVVPLSVPMLVVVYALLANGLYLGLIYSGYSRRFRDPFLTRLGVGLGVCANLYALPLAPQISYMFVINLFVPLAYGALRFSRREFLVAGVLLSAVLGMMFATGLAEVPRVSQFDPNERFLSWLVIALAIARFIVIQTEIARLAGKLRERNDALRLATARLEQQASHDELTGLYNRRAFMRLLQKEIARVQRIESTFCVVLLDIDHFKQVNDRFGHAVGDQVLATIAQIYTQAVRDSDICARYGGEEFTVLARDADLDGVAAMIERLRSSVEAHDWQSIQEGLHVTISAGVACWRRGESQTDVLRRADDAMYAAKDAGRNRVCVSR